jgi:hypothetical protein
MQAMKIQAAEWRRFEQVAPAIVDQILWSLAARRAAGESEDLLHALHGVVADPRTENPAALEAALAQRMELLAAAQERRN